MKLINRRWRLPALLFALTGAVLATSCGPGDAPEIVLFNGHVVTGDPARPRAEALAIRGERMALIGTSAEVLAAAGRKTRKIDLAGRTVVPGRNDSLVHFMPDPLGVELDFPSKDPPWPEVTASIRGALEEASPDTWLFGQVGRETMLNPAATRAALDRLAPRNPVLLRAGAEHGYLLNSAAMAQAGIAAKEPDPAGGRYERVAGSREINGKAWEYARWKIDRYLATQVNDRQAMAALRAMSDEALRRGVTTVQATSAMPVERLAQLAARARLPVRLKAVALPGSTEAGRDVSEIDQLAGLPRLSPMVTAGGVRWILSSGDGVRLNFPPAEIAAMLRESVEKNGQLLLECAGDSCAAAVLGEMEKLRGTVDWKTKRVGIESAAALSAEVQRRAQAVGVVLTPTDSGSLAVGQPADLAVFPGAPGSESVMTFVGGRLVYPRSEEETPGGN